MREQIGLNNEQVLQYLTEFENILSKELKKRTTKADGLDRQ